MRVQVPLRQAYRLINHGPTTLVTTAAEGVRNVMTCAWVVPLDIDPPRICAVIEKDAYTRDLLDRTGEFVVNVPTVSMIDTVFAVGKCTGREVAKFDRFGLRTSPAAKVAPPLVEGCVAWLECRVLPEAGVRERYDLVLADALEAWADDAAFANGLWDFKDPAKRTLHHMSKTSFFAIGERVDARPPT